MITKREDVIMEAESERERLGECSSAGFEDKGPQAKDAGGLRKHSPEPPKWMRSADSWCQPGETDLGPLASKAVCGVLLQQQ